MNNHGDDCYFYYYSTCTKGDTCPFRHCEAAMGNETVCNLWQEGRCFRTVCKFRHMEITKKRKEIPCYWENQLAGCQKRHCAFFHERPRYIDSIYFPPDKSLNKNEEQPQEEPVPLPATPLPTVANPQLRGVKTEGQEPVPSPTHPPVVINPTDDDEDEDDQFSEEGEDGKIGPSPRKLPKSDDSLNFGVSTLEEIRLRKALKASMKKANYPIQNAESTANGEKENIQSFFRPSIYRARDGEKEESSRMSAPQVFEESGRTRGSVSERLGKIMPNVNSGEGISLKRSLAERLGRLVEDDDSLMPPQKSLKSIKERLHLPADPAAATPGAEKSTGSKKTTEEIRIKTLEEIRQEKAAKSKSQSPTSVTPETTITKTIPTKNTKLLKRASKDHFIGHIKTFSEVLHAKKKRQEDQQEQNPSPPKKVRENAEEVPNKISDMPNNVKHDTEFTKGDEVRVKTLEEIRKEKAKRLQAQQVQDAPNKNSETEENGTKRPRLFRMKKQVSHAGDGSDIISEVTEKPQKVPTAAPEPSSANSSSSVKVKSFEEIMREKRLRKQEMAEQASSNSQTKDPVEVEPSPKPSVDGTRKIRAKVRLTPPVSSSSPPNTSGPVRKLITFKSKAASPQKSTAPPASPAITGVTSAPRKQSSSPRQPETHLQNLSGSSDALDNNTGCPPATAAPQSPTVENTAAEKTLTGDNKVRPKLNVKPSVMKPAVQVKPGQKRRGAERSAVAAVKPLNTASAVVEEPLQETAFKDRQVFPSASADIQLSSAVPQSPSTLLESSTSSSPVREELQMVPVFTQSSRQETKLAVSLPASREVCTVPQSPVQKTPTHCKSRRQSAAASRTASTTSTTASTSAVDDFEELMNEFTDDHMEGDMDPGIGEDDLLQELSDMIDS